MEVETVRGIDDSEAIAASGPQSEARYEPGYRSMHVNDVITSAGNDATDLMRRG